MPRVDIMEYPALKAHLDQYWDKISKRADRGDTPYNLRNCAYLEDFNHPKIVWGEISDRSKFAYEAEGRYIPEATTFLMSGANLPYLLCVLNSPLSEWFFSKVGTTTGVGTVRWKKYTIQELLIPLANDEDMIKISHYVDDYINGDMSIESLATKANATIYKIVGLNKDEITYVENFYPSVV